MTDEKMRVAIAEAQGYALHWSGSCSRLVHPNGSVIWECRQKDWWPEFKLPDYLYDLDAMREASLSLPLTQRAIMFGFLYKMGGCMMETAFLSARQHAEAYLKTVGKWEES